MFLYFKYINMLIVMALFTNSCTEEDNILINCQDPNNDCFMDAPSIESISSYSPNSIYFSFSNLSNESLQLQRSIDNVVDTTYVLEQNYYGELIDTVNINYNTYNYLLRYKNELGISNPIEFNITHDFPGVLEESFEISTINENATRLDWYYNIDDHFTKSYNDIEWIISKEKFNSQSNTWNNYSDIILNEFISNDNYYSYTDNYDISFSDSLRYTISLNLDNFISTLTTSNIRVNFPQLESIEWVPLNSSTILLNWKIDNTLSDNLTSVKITNTRSNDYIYETNESIFESSIIDDISLYNDNVIANEIIEYTIEWCGSSMCADTTFSAKTFPYYHMQYIPSFNNLIFNENNTVNTDAFYIDIYEVSDDLYINPTLNNKNQTLSSNPKNNINILSARSFCNDRSNSHNLDLMYNLGNIEFTEEYDVLYSEWMHTRSGFRLPTESEWFAAAAASYNWNTQQVIQFDYTTQVDNGELNCSFANIMNCFNDITTIGYFNGDNMPNYQTSTSPNGLYDCNGNVKEWAEKSTEYYHSSADRSILIGGDYMSPASISKNNSFIYEDNTFSHSTIGFRTMLLAAPYLELFCDETNSTYVNGKCLIIY